MINKLIYNITPFFALTFYLIVLATYILITDGSGWGGVAAIAMLALSLILFVIDFILKKVCKKYYQLLITEITIGVIIMFIFNF